MKTIRLYTLAAMVLLAAMHLMAVNTIMYTATYDKSPQLGTDTLGGVTYSTVAYEGLYNGGDPGMPSLPVDYIKFSVPYNAVNFTVSTLLRNTFIYNVPHLLYPCQEPVPTDGSEPQGITLPDSTAYFSNTTFPSQQAWVVDEGFLAGENHIVTVAVMPISYYHGSGSNAYNRVRVSETVRLTLRYELNDSTAPAPLIRQDSVLRQEGYELTQSLVANPGNVVANAPVMMTMDSTLVFNPLSGGDGLNGGDHTIGPGIDPGDLIGDGGQLQEAEHNIPYLIVTTNELYHSMRRLAALKRQKGYNVHIVTMDQVMNDSFARTGDVFRQQDGTYYVAHSDSAGVLRQFLKLYFSFYGTKYVLLAGKNLPYRTINCRDGNREIKGHGDIYFSDLSADWIDNTNNIDFNPELFIGRLLVENNDQLNAYMDKLFRYELNPGHGDYSYLKNALFTTGNDFFDSFLKGLSLFKSILEPIFTQQTSLTEVLNQDIPKGVDVINSISVNHPAFVSTFNHGGPSFIKVYGKDSFNHRYFIMAIDSVNVLQQGYINTETGNGLNNMQNKYYPSIFYSLSCQTMPFYKIPDFNVDLNMGESFTLGKDYGGPVYMGNTESVNSYAIEGLAEEFARTIINETQVLGKADALSKLKLRPDFRSLVAVVHNYLGDPSLDMWTNIPDTFDNVGITRTDSTIHITNINCDSAVIVYTNPLDLKTKSITVSSSGTFNNVNTNGCIMIYKHNHIPYIAPLEFQNYIIQKSQYVIASDVIAGKIIDENRNQGDVIINSGVNYEIEASGTVTLQDGFKVEKGATFAVYPACF